MLEKLKKSPVVGSDETGCRVGGRKAWMWVWCNERYVYLKVSDNRGYDTITEVLGSEQQNFITVSDCFAAQLKLNTPDKQICLAHLLRECEGLHEKYNSQWALLLKSKLEQIIQITKDKTIAPHTVQILEEELLSILKRARGRAHEKVRVFRN